MKTINQIKSAYQSQSQVVLGVVGDSTGCGYGANGGPNVWTNGLPYSYLNQPYNSPNWPSWPEPNPYNIVTRAAPDNSIEVESQNNPDILGPFQLLRVALQAMNGTSEVWNWSAGGETAADAISKFRVATLAAQNPKPHAVIIALGINDFTNRTFVQYQADMRTLVQQCIDYDMLPILMKQHMICDWDYTMALSPDQWTPSDGYADWIAENDVIAAEFAISVIDGFSYSVPFDITKMYDPAHKNAAGYLDVKNDVIALLASAVGADWYGLPFWGKKQSDGIWVLCPLKKYSGIEWTTIQEKGQRSY